MKATLEFNLPDEEHEFREALDGCDALLALSDISEALRSRCKYGKPDNVTTPEDAYDDIRAEFWSILEARDLDLDR